MTPRKKMTITPTSAEEAPMSDTYGNDEPDTQTISDAEHAQNMLESSLGTTEMTDAEAIETLVRTDETHLTDDEPKQVGLPVDMSEPGTIKPVQVKVGTTEGTTKQRTQGTNPEKFHCLSEIDDGVFVAWDRCHNGSSRHSIADCKCKGGPTEPPYVTKWRQEWIEKRDKEKRPKKAAKTRDYAAEDLAQREADARQIQENEALAATVSDGIETATQAVAAASEEDNQ